MLPMDSRRKQPTVIGSGADDLGTEAKKRCMARFVNAVRDGDVNAAVDAMTDYNALCELDECADD